MTGNGLQDKVAVVTGGGGVLGGAMARELARAGCRVALLNRSGARAEAVARDIGSAGGRARWIACDVLDQRQLRAAAEQVEAHFGPCDILVNAAGGNRPGGTTAGDFLEAADLAAPGGRSFFDLDGTDAGEVFNLNFLGTFLASQVFARRMAERGSGCVINISSMNAFRPLTRIPAYSGAKAAVSNFTQWLACHLAHVHIRVNAIAPGFFLTDQNRALLTAADGSLSPRGRKIIDHTPMGRFGSPDDLAGALRFLADDSRSGFITGVVLPVDGGFSAYAGV